MSQVVGVILGRVTQREAVDPFAQRFDDFLANQVLLARIGQLPGQRLDQPPADDRLRERTVA